MTALLTGLVSLLVFGAVILVHELGHFLAARHCGIHVEEFSIGFGPKIFQRRRGSTTYTLRLFPLGGYNLFSPLPEDNEDADAEETAAPAPPPSSRAGAACFRSLCRTSPLRKLPPGSVLS